MRASKQIPLICSLIFSTLSFASITFSVVPTLPAEDWPMWGRSPSRNHAVDVHVPTKWNVGRFDRRTGKWDQSEAFNIKWFARLGSQTYGNPVVAGGRVFVGTNNSAGYLKRYPSNVDVSCMICFRESDGEFLWQYSSEKLPTGRVHDWPLQGICSAPLVEEDRMWFVDNRGRVVCLDTEGFSDDEDDGPVVDEPRRLFAVLMGLDSESWRRSRVGNLSRAGAINALFEANGIEFSCAQIDDDESPGQSTVADGKTRVSYRLEFKDYELRAYRADRDPREPVFVAKYDTVRSLDGGVIPPRLHALLAEMDIVVPDSTKVHTEIPGTEWSVPRRTDGSHQMLSIKLEQGLWLSVSDPTTAGNRDEADVVWRLDMMKELGVLQHNMATCAPTCWGDLLFVCTSNGLDESHINLPAPNAPSFIALSKTTGELLWSDNSPGKNILHGQWSSPAIAELGGVPQVIFPGGDGWIYSFHAEQYNKQKGTPILLWKFDVNPKESEWLLGGSGTRNNAIPIPVIYEGLVYVGVGQDPEHGEGEGHLWCIDPTRRGDVSAELAMAVIDGNQVPIPHRRTQAVIKENGEVAIANPNSAVVWHYDRFDQDGDGEIEFEEEMHRTLGSPAIKDDLLFAADFSGLVHCLHAKTGKVHWTCDLLAQCWGSPLIAADRVYVGDEDGDIAVFTLSDDSSLSTEYATHVYNGKTYTDKQPRQENRTPSSIYTTPIVANGVLYITDKSRLYAISAMQDRSD